MNRLAQPLSWFTTLLIPLALFGLGVRLLLTPVFLQFEYGLPSFPPDPYGFTASDRLRWGQYGVNYLVNAADISYLAALNLDDRTPLFSERELGHMQDVKVVVGGFLRLWLADLAALVLLWFWSWRGSWTQSYVRGLRRGGWLTLALALAGGLVATLGASGSGDLFWQFFTDFHGLFFKGDSWMFAYSDTLIRLYPIKFWQDAVLYIGVIAALGAAALTLGLRVRSLDGKS
jgi:integral membrane protein (TIGR01906 family)